MSDYQEQEKLLSNLAQAEDSICDIIRITAETLGELESLPNSNLNKLDTLALEFVNIVSSVQKNLKSNSTSLSPTDTSDREALYRDSFNQINSELNDLIEKLTDSTSNKI